MTTVLLFTVSTLANTNLTLRTSKHISIFWQIWRGSSLINTSIRLSAHHYQGQSFYRVTGIYIVLHIELTFDLSMTLNFLSGDDEVTVAICLFWRRWKNFIKLPFFFKNSKYFTHVFKLWTITVSVDVFKWHRSEMIRRCGAGAFSTHRCRSGKPPLHIISEVRMGQGRIQNC